MEKNCLKLRMCEELDKIPRPFQHTAFYRWPVDSSSSKDLLLAGLALHGLPKLTQNLHPTTTLFPKVSRGPIVRDLHSKHSTFRSFRGRGWNKIKSTKFHANQFAVRLKLTSYSRCLGLHAQIVHVIVTFRAQTPISLQSCIL